MIKAIKFVNIPVRDQDRSLEFYTQKLGFRVMTDAPFDGKQRWIELGIPRAETRLVLFTAGGQEAMIGGFMNLSFVTDDVEATATELKGRGVEFVQDRRRPTGVRPRSSKTPMATSSCCPRTEQSASVRVFHTPRAHEIEKPPGGPGNRHRDVDRRFPGVRLFGAYGVV